MDQNGNGMELGFGPGHIVLDGDPAPPKEGGGAQQPPTFRLMSVVAKRSPISATAELMYTKADNGLVDCRSHVNMFTQMYGLQRSASVDSVVVLVRTSVHSLWSDYLSRSLACVLRDTVRRCPL